MHEDVSLGLRSLILCSYCTLTSVNFLSMWTKRQARVFFFSRSLLVSGKGMCFLESAPTLEVKVEGPRWCVWSWTTPSRAALPCRSWWMSRGRRRKREVSNTMSRSVWWYGTCSLLGCNWLLQAALACGCVVETGSSCWGCGVSQCRSRNPTLTKKNNKRTIH